ncbi:MAG: hypothetical protein GY927_25805 [bacterium]|nr:hypothetical protein [bacterium]
MHVLPKGFHRIRHYGLLASGGKASNLAKLRKLLHVPPSAHETDESEINGEVEALAQPCRCCGGSIVIIEVFKRGCIPRARWSPEGIDSS